MFIITILLDDPMHQEMLEWVKEIAESSGYSYSSLREPSNPPNEVHFQKYVRKYTDNVLSKFTDIQQCIYQLLFISITFKFERKNIER